MRQNPPVEQITSPRQSQTTKENGATSPLIEKGSQKRTREPEEIKYNLRQPRLSAPQESRNFNYVSIYLKKMAI